MIFADYRFRRGCYFDYNRLSVGQYDSGAPFVFGNVRITSGVPFIQHWNGYLGQIAITRFKLVFHNKNQTENVFTLTETPLKGYSYIERLTSTYDQLWRYSSPAIVIFVGV